MANRYRVSAFSRDGSLLADGDGHTVRAALFEIAEKLGDVVGDYAPDDRYPVTVKLVVERKEEEE